MRAIRAGIRFPVAAGTRNIVGPPVVAAISSGWILGVVSRSFGDHNAVASASPSDAMRTFADRRLTTF